MNILLVYAHPEPASFNGAMRDAAVETLTAAGHEIVVSDLYAMRFAAVAGAGDFLAPAEPGFVKLQREQIHARETGTFAPEIAAEQEKLSRADLVLFQFPLWWLSVPAILKGWFDRVLTAGFAYGGGRWFDKGGLAGKRAMCALTTGAPKAMFEARGLYGGTIEEILVPVLYGTLFFAGMQVLPPFVAWGPAHGDDSRRAAYLDAYRQHLLAAGTTAPIAYRPLADYDGDRRLLPGLASRIRGLEE